MCTASYAHFCIHYSMVAIKNLVSVYCYIIEPIYLFLRPPGCIPSNNHCPVLHIYVFIFVWVGFVHGFCLLVCFIFYIANF